MQFAYRPTELQINPGETHLTALSTAIIQPAVIYRPKVVYS